MSLELGGSTGRFTELNIGWIYGGSGGNFGGLLLRNEGKIQV